MKTLIAMICLLAFSISNAATTITYQGQLQDGTGPVDATVDMNFALYDAADGNQVGTTVSLTDVNVVDGLFQVELNFGEQAYAAGLWLAAEVEGEPLTPRQAITGAPFAISATPGSGSHWELSGADIYYSEGNVGIGTSSPNVPLNVVGSTQFGEAANQASGANSFVAGGNETNSNHAQGDRSFVGGGRDNTATGSDSFVGGGQGNTATSPLGFTGAFVGGGTGNMANANRSFVGGGRGNTASGSRSFVGSGLGNTADGRDSFIAGGVGNTASGERSFAAGRSANAEHDGAFVWSDNNIATFSSTGEHQFLIQASGGVGIGTNSPNNQLSIAGSADFSGQVGIGTEDPGAMLQVNGNLISGHLANSATGTNSFVAGGASGSSNRAEGDMSFVGGGQGNAANESESFVGSGFENTANGIMSFVGGGFRNTAGGFRSFSGGGENNIASGSYSFVGGGVSNEASGQRSFIGGGSNNSATGNFSFAAGRRAKAEHIGSFVWADRHSSSGLDFSSTGDDQFLIRAGGGVGIGTNSPETDLHIKAESSSAALILENATDVNGWGIGTGISSGNFNFYYNSDVSGFTTTGTRLGGISNTSGEYSANSDRRLKADIEPLEDVLASVLQLKPASYRFLRSGVDGERSIGFVAQDVQETFPEIVETGEEDDYLSLTYASFSVLAIGAIQEQQVLIETQADEIAALNDRIDRLEQILTSDR